MGFAAASSRSARRVLAVVGLTGWSPGGLGSVGAAPSLVDGVSLEVSMAGACLTIVPVPGSMTASLRSGGVLPSVVSARICTGRRHRSPARPCRAARGRTPPRGAAVRSVLVVVRRGRPPRPATVLLGPDLDADLVLGVVDAVLPGHPDGGVARAPSGARTGRPRLGGPARLRAPAASAGSAGRARLGEGCAVGRRARAGADGDLDLTDLRRDRRGVDLGLAAAAACRRVPPAAAPRASAAGLPRWLRR